jgi:hypothetical protein
MLGKKVRILHRLEHDHPGIERRAFGAGANRQ